MYCLLCFLKKKLDPAVIKTLTSVETQIKCDNLCQFLDANKSGLEMKVRGAGYLTLSLIVTVQYNTISS